MSITSLIAELKQAYADAGLDCAAGLLPPASKTDLDVMTAELALPLPAELREVYAIHGGQEYFKAGVTGLFGSHRLWHPREVVEVYKDNCDILLQYGNWRVELIPFAAWDAYELCIDAVTGEVWEFTASGGLSCHRPTIAVVLQEILDAVLAGEEPMLREYR